MRCQPLPIIKWGNVVAERERVTELTRSVNAKLESEEQLRLFIENAPTAQAMFDRDMRYLCMSRRWRSDYGLGEFDLFQMSHYEVFPEAAGQWKEVHRRGLAGEAVREDVDRLERADGSVQWVRWEVRPWYDSAGQVGGIVIFTEDFTERKRAEEELIALDSSLDQRAKDRTKELKDSIEELQSFSYSVSHDLRAPLRHINSAAAIFFEDYGENIPKEAHVYLEKIQAASSKMGLMVDSLLELSQVSRTKLVLNAINLSELVAQEISMYREIDPQRDLDTVVEEDVTVWGDLTLLRQVVANLIGNAWKYTSKKPTARIEFGKTYLDGKETLFVRDNGVGFDNAYKNKLFKAFERLHGTDFKGNGIGLATTKRIIKRHGGEIWGEGRVNEGATFYLTFPGH